MKEWLTAHEAAFLIGRSERTIYRWVRRNKLLARITPEGILEVRASDVTKTESTTRRGRPRHADPAPT